MSDLELEAYLSGFLEGFQSGLENGVQGIVEQREPWLGKVTTNE